MKIKIEFDTDNAAFEEDPKYELRRVLQLVTERLCERPGRKTSGVILDANGNKVGTYERE